MATTSSEGIGRIVERPPIAPGSGWTLKIAIGLFSIVVGVSYVMRGIPDPWWITSGYLSDPGEIVAKNAITYPICAPWDARSAGALSASLRRQAGLSGTHVARRVSTAPLAAGGDTQLGVLLPTDASIVKVYCGIAHRDTRVQECSAASCSPPTGFLITDIQYTRARALNFSIRNKGASAAQNVQFWVLWQGR